MSLTPLQRRLAWVAVALGLVVGGAQAARVWLGPYAVRSVLRLAGASAIRFRAVHGTPWHLEIDGISCRFQTREFAARRIVLDRPHWWTASLGAVRVEDAELPVYPDGSDAGRWDWAVMGEAPASGDAVSLPLTTLELDGRILVRMSSFPERVVTVKLEGQPRSATSWIGSLLAEGEGFRLAGTGSLLRAGQQLDFQVLSAELDLALWSGAIQGLVSLPGAPWRLRGKLSAVAEGSVTARRFASTARVSLRDGAMQVLARDIAVDGAEADLEFSDLWKFRTKSGALRLQALRVGRLKATDVAADFGLWGEQAVVVNSATGTLLGGTVAVAPFRFLRNQREVILHLQGKGLDAARAQELVPDLPAVLSGRIDADLPVRIQAMGVRLESGSVTLAAGAPGGLQFEAPALLRSGAELDEASVQALKAAGPGPMRLRLEALRLEVRPPGLPLGSSARLRFSGVGEAGPVAARLNVNGSIERYLEVLP